MSQQVLSKHLTNEFHHTKSDALNLGLGQNNDFNTVLVSSL